MIPLDVLRDLVGFHEGAVASLQLDVLDSGSSHVSYRVRAPGISAVVKAYNPPLSDVRLALIRDLNEEEPDLGLSVPVFRDMRFRAMKVGGDRQLWLSRPFYEGEPFVLGNAAQLDRATRLLIRLSRVVAPTGSPHAARWPAPVECWMAAGAAGATGELERTLYDIAPHTARARLAVYRKALDSALEVFAPDVWQSLPNVLSHGDIHGNNLLFVADSLSAVLDWDDVGYRPLAWDAAKACVFLCRRERGAFRVDFRLVEGLLATLADDGGLSVAAIRLLPSLALLYFVPRPAHLRALAGDRAKLTWYLDWTQAACEALGVGWTA